MSSEEEYHQENLPLSELYQANLAGGPISLVLGISTKIRLNYFSLIDASDYPAPAAIICHLYAVSVLLTTTAIFLPPSGAVRVSACQIINIRASVWFTKPVLKKQKEKKKEKKKREKKNDDDDKDNNDND
ncbi:uncharacterized protein CIMG_12842 [Coccidioides immitis RS]|uniref:Uncharacterized protein n=1 Tax=Coccidioides immitis (strain RS) TaxID=246410 RepID=J3KHM6_COCIM|nr:uncharacterized protein CIMG_12842 [Coccidioides immitis RS]EAS35387.3 hypothetical protein CIMG_12842 [Coccidioides immitis RS]